MVGDCGPVPGARRPPPLGAIRAGVRSTLETPPPDFRHLFDMTDQHGTFEHALFTQPRAEHGYCSDDMARVLIVVAREPDQVPALRGLAMLSLRFLQDALDSHGRCRNRMDRFGAWGVPPAVNDSWGRTIWGLGTAVSQSDDHLIRHLAARGLERAMTQRSPWPKAMAFAALGAAELLSVDPGNLTAVALLSDAADAMDAMDGPQQGRWTWPAHRLTYANATLPEAMIAAGSVLGRPLLVEQGL